MLGGCQWYEMFSISSVNICWVIVMELALMGQGGSELVAT